MKAGIRSFCETSTMSISCFHEENPEGNWTTQAELQRLADVLRRKQISCRLDCQLIMLSHDVSCLMLCVDIDCRQPRGQPDHRGEAAAAAGHHSKHFNASSMGCHTVLRACAGTRTGNLTTVAELQRLAGSYADGMLCDMIHIDTLHAWAAGNPEGNWTTEAELRRLAGIYTELPTTLEEDQELLEQIGAECWHTHIFRQLH